MKINFKDFSAEELAHNGLFIRWLKGNDPEADWFWKSFIEEHPEKLAEIEQAKKIAMLFIKQDEVLPEEDVNSMRTKLLMSIHAEKEMNRDNLVQIITIDKRMHKLRWMKWAAVVSVPLLFAFAAYWFSPILRNREPAPLQLAQRTNKEEKISKKGQKSVLLLPDGTKVWLNVDSRLDYSLDFNSSGTREVILEGEAFFDVAHNPEKPFIVRASALSVKVLGTAFNVKAYSTDKTIETTLIRGKVSINTGDNEKSEGSPLILVPNQRAVFLKQNNTINVEQIVPERIISWRNDKLIFDETPLLDAMSQLERWYNVKIHFETNVDDLNCNLTAELKDEKLPDVLKLLETSHGVQYSIKDAEIYITEIHCK